MTKSGIEETYSFHHKQNEWVGKKVILSKERGEFLRSHIGTGKHILDIGCRDGGLTETYCAGNTVLAVDIDPNELSKIKLEGVTTQQIDLNGDWNLPASTFDVVVAAEVIEHLFYPNRVMDKIIHVLKPNGMLIGTIPRAFNVQDRIKFLFGSKHNTSLDDPTHINHFTYTEFKDLLSTYFFDVEIYAWHPPRYRYLKYVHPNLFATKLFFAASGVGKKEIKGKTGNNRIW